MNAPAPIAALLADGTRRHNLKASMTKGLCSRIERYPYEAWRQGYRRFFKKEIARNFAHTYCPKEPS